MYYHIEGQLVHTDATVAVIDCGGVGYKLTVSGTTISRIPKLGEKLKLFTHLVVREDIMDLIGFYSVEEKNAFLMLISVSGIGTKVALSVLSSLTPERFACAVAAGDYKELSIAHGVSTKTAQKIILELRDKIGKSDISALSGGSPAKGARTAANAGSGVIPDAMNALLVLGYSRAEAGSALAETEPGLPLEEVIKTALKKLVR